jgi:hypothetical protein
VSVVKSDRVVVLMGQSSEKPYQHVKSIRPRYESAIGTHKRSQFFICTHSGLLSIALRFLCVDHLGQSSGVLPGPILNYGAVRLQPAGRVGPHAEPA